MRGKEGQGDNDDQFKLRDFSDCPPFLGGAMRRTTCAESPIHCLSDALFSLRGMYSASLCVAGRHVVGLETWSSMSVG